MDDIFAPAYLELLRMAEEPEGKPDCALHDFGKMGYAAGFVELRVCPEREDLGEMFCRISTSTGSGRCGAVFGSEVFKPHICL